MKTKEEAIKALELCAGRKDRCRECSYNEGIFNDCQTILMQDAAELLKGAGDGTSQKLDSSGT